jgi:hypothetical protein
MSHFIRKLVPAVLLAVVAPLTMGLGNPEFVPATGVLSLKAVDVNGVKTYENVDIQLNMATGTFKIVKASVADTRIPDLPIQEFTKNGLKVGIRGCAAVAQDVTCHVVFTSVEFNRDIRMAGTSQVNPGEYWTFVTDNKGNNYSPSAITLSNTNGEGSITKTLIANVPTPATITMKNVSTSATSFASIIFRIQSGGNL